MFRSVWWRSRRSREARPHCLMSRQGMSARDLVPMGWRECRRSVHTMTSSTGGKNGQGRPVRRRGGSRHPRRGDPRGRWVRLVRYPERADPRSARLRRPGPGGREQQLRRGRLGARAAAAGGSDPADHRVVRGREQGVRAAVPGRGARGGADPAGHAGRASSCRWERDRGVLHADRGGHAGGLRRAAVALLPRRVGARGVAPEAGRDVHRAGRRRTSSCARRRSPPTTRWSGPRGATAWATWCSTRPPGTSTRCARPPVR